MEKISQPPRPRIPAEARARSGSPSADDDSTQTNLGPDRRSQARSLAGLLEAHRDEKHAVILQDYPDPDAIACAVAHRLISAEYDIRCEILYKGSISHPQNLALVQLMDLRLQAFTGDYGLEEFDGAVFVDNQGSTSEDLVAALAAAGVPTLVVVDHHDIQDLLEPAFADIRRIGSASTIYSEYLEQGIVRLDRDDPEHVQTATALQLGLYTDTGGMLRAGMDDFHAAGYLSQFSDQEMLQKIMAQSRSKHTMEVIHKVLDSRVITEGFSIAGAEYIRSEDRDAIPQAADFLLTEENVHTAIVYGILRKEKQVESLVGSLRTNKLTLSPDKFLKDALGTDEAGLAYGGGKQYAGGFDIPVGFLSGGDSKEFEELKWRVFDGQLKNRLFNYIGAERTQEG